MGLKWHLADFNLNTGPKKTVLCRSHVLVLLTMYLYFVKFLVIVFWSELCALPDNNTYTTFLSTQISANSVLNNILKKCILSFLFRHWDSLKVVNGLRLNMHDRFNSTLLYCGHIKDWVILIFVAASLAKRIETQSLRKDGATEKCYRVIKEKYFNPKDN